MEKNSSFIVFAHPIKTYPRGKVKANPRSQQFFSKRHAKFGIWSFTGAWMLVLGAYLRQII
jgi:hypothetical protein